VTLCELQVADPAIRDIVAGRYPDAERLMALCASSHESAQRIIERARSSGALRQDFTGEDLVFIFATNAMLSRAAQDTAPEAWRRGVAFVLDGLRAEAARGKLPADPLTPDQLFTVMGNLSGESSH
jgi:hypothetical protein